jgi:hypothetical protein
LDYGDRPLKLSVFAKKILSYWLENPNAKDTSDGIADWWVRYQEFRHWRPRVKKALAELVEMKLVLKKKGQKGRGSQVYYELNRQFEADIPRIIGRAQRK